MRKQKRESYNWSKRRRKTQKEKTKSSLHLVVSRNCRKTHTVKKGKQKEKKKTPSTDKTRLMLADNTNHRWCESTTIKDMKRNIAIGRSSTFAVGFLALVLLFARRLVRRRVRV